MKSAKWAVFFLFLVIQSVFVVSVSADQGQPPAATPVFVCQPMRAYDPGMCLTDTALNDPLADRIPVILIHGWNKDEIPGKPDIMVWSRLMDHLKQNQWFNEKYKFYYLLYLSNVQGIRDMGLTFADLINQMDETDPSFRGKPLVIIGHSMGGLVARSFMQEPRSRNSSGFGGDRVLRLITLGTPHHGTPIANGPARDHKAGDLASYLFDLIDHGLFNSSLTWSTDNRFDLHWDNYDGLLDYDKYPEDNIWLKWLNSVNTFENKISVYGGTVEPLTQFDDCIFSGFKDPGCLSGIMRDNLGISQSDGVVPLNSALFYPCTDCVSRQIFSGYDHFEIVIGKSDQDSNLFNAIAGDLSDLVADGDSRFNDMVLMGDPKSEQFHNLRGWGAMVHNGKYNVSAHNQPIRGRSSVDLYIDHKVITLLDAYIPAVELFINFGNGPCDDSFDVHVGDDKIFSFSDEYIGSKIKPEYGGLVLWVPIKSLGKHRVTVTFVNKSTDSCGYAPVEMIAMIPDFH